VQETVEALRANYLAKESDLFIFSDGAKNAKDREAVNEVRRFIRGIGSFSQLEIIESPANKGLSSSIVSGVTSVIAQYGRIIVLEDDMVTSPYFLLYMNEALERHENEEKVISIHGYTYPTKETLPETFFLRGADCWGWGTWRRGWALFERDAVKLLSELKQKRLTRIFDYDGAWNYTRMLQAHIRGKNDSWAVRWHASAFLKGRLTLYPGRSLVRNIGLDSTGVHCRTSEAFDVNLSEHPISIVNIPISENLLARELIKAFFQSMRPSLVDRARRLLPPSLKAQNRKDRGQSLWFFK
jgi:hypothetical protein